MGGYSPPPHYHLWIDLTHFWLRRYRAIELGKVLQGFWRPKIFRIDRFVLANPSQMRQGASVVAWVHVGNAVHLAAEEVDRNISGKTPEQNCIWVGKE